MKIDLKNFETETIRKRNINMKERETIQNKKFKIKKKKRRKYLSCHWNSGTIGDHLSIQCAYVNDEKEHDENVVKKSEETEYSLGYDVQRTDEVNERDENEKAKSDAIPNAEVV